MINDKIRNIIFETTRVSTSTIFLRVSGVTHGRIVGTDETRIAVQQAAQKLDRLFLRNNVASVELLNAIIDHLPPGTRDRKEGYVCLFVEDELHERSIRSVAFQDLRSEDYFCYIAYMYLYLHVAYLGGVDPCGESPESSIESSHRESLRRLRFGQGTTRYITLTRVYSPR